MSTEHYPHDVCPKCSTASAPAEGVPDQTLRDCPNCGHMWMEDLDRPPRLPRDETKDIAVMYDDDADDGRYLAVEPDNTIHMFPNEDSACKFQRDWRREHGLHPITGEPN
jgi:hypothetical protein